jgi:hypothetical protein
MAIWGQDRGFCMEQKLNCNDLEAIIAFDTTLVENVGASKFRVRKLLQSVLRWELLADPASSKFRGRRTKDEGRRTKDEGRRTKDEGRRTKDEYEYE